MATDTVDLIGRTVSETNQWLREIDEMLGWNDRRLALHALRGVLHLIRDRIPLDEAAQLSAQLPTLVRGLYWEQWDPSRTPITDRSEAVLLHRIAEEFRSYEGGLDLPAIARAVFSVLTLHLDWGEVDDVRRALPKRMQQLW
ncbi:MAG TPA: DUF2267 domain-containing protein, partial [Candidatus Elarobacter sp.]